EEDRLRRMRLIVAALWHGEIADLPELPSDGLLLTRLAGRFVVWKFLVDQLLLFDVFSSEAFPSLIWDERDRLKAAVAKRFAELGVLIPGAAADGYAGR